MSEDKKLQFYEDGGNDEQAAFNYTQQLICVVQIFGLS